MQNVIKHLDGIAKAFNGQAQQTLKTIKNMPDSSRRNKLLEELKFSQEGEQEYLEAIEVLKAHKA